MITFIAVVIAFYDFLIYVMHVGVRDGRLFIFRDFFILCFCFVFGRVCSNIIDLKWI